MLTVSRCWSTRRREYQYVVLLVDDQITRATRDQLMDLLWAENVRARRYFYPGCHRMQPYDSLYPQPAGRLRVTERLVQQVLLLPTGTTISSQDISIDMPDHQVCRLARCGDQPTDVR